MVLVGASGHAKVIAEIIRAKPDLQIEKVIDRNTEIKMFLEMKVEHEMTAEIAEMPFFISIGDNYIRNKLSNSFKGIPIKPLFHEKAIISPNSQIGNGTVVMPGAVCNSHTQIGDHCILNTSSIVEHDCILSDFVHISPNATVTGGVHIGTGSHVGANAVIIPGVKIGKWVVIGAGAVIIEDIPDYAVVVGNPGKIIKFKNIENE